MKHERLFDAVLRRIGDQGDMPIRIRSRTLEVIVRACGFDRWEIEGVTTPYREVDAPALEALVVLAKRSCVVAQPANDNIDRVAASVLAEAIVDSAPAITTFTACEWDCLSEDGQVWLSVIVGEAVRRTGGKLGEAAHG